jgi:hypothetical protein
MTKIGDTKASKFPKRDAKSISLNNIGLDVNRFNISIIAMRWSYIVGQLGGLFTVYTAVWSRRPILLHIQIDIILLLWGLWVCGQGVSLVYHIERSVITVCFGQRFVAKGRVPVLGVVIFYPFADHALGDKAVHQLM